MKDPLMILQGIPRRRAELGRDEDDAVGAIEKKLQLAGYGLEKIQGSAPARVAGHSGTLPQKCPRCDRMFNHPLPMARHLVATHGVAKKKEGARGSSRAKRH